jgi:hypothetical protein
LRFSWRAATPADSAGYTDVRNFVRNSWRCPETVHTPYRVFLRNNTHIMKTDRYTFPVAALAIIAGLVVSFFNAG